MCVVKPYPFKPRIIRDDEIMTKQAVGWLHGFISVFIFLGINQVVSRYASVVLEVNPVVYSCAAFSSCALILLMLGGSGTLAKETMRSIDTWTYGIVLMLSYIIGMILYAYVTSTELTMLQKISVGMSLFGSWFFIGRAPDRYQIIGTIIITVGVLVVAADIEGPNRGLIYFLSILYGLAQVARVFVAELHRPHAKAASLIASDPRARARVIGFVMLVVSSLFLVLAALVAFAQESNSEPFIHGLPMLEDFMHPASILSGMLVGILLIAPLRLLEFSSSNIIKAENFMVILTFMTVATFFWEWVTRPITGLSIDAISHNDIIAAIFITAGGLLISLTRSIKKRSAWEDYIIYSVQNLQLVEDSREIVANTIEHFNGDIKKAASALGVPSSVVSAFLEDSEKVIAFKELPTIARNYRKNVASADSLTGLANRAAFLTALKSASYEVETFSILYLDLDKFKPVNDTYGHEAGDKILQGVADRLRKTFPTRSAITRMGGDEYCVLLLDANKKLATNDAEKLKAIIAKPFKLDGIKQPITIGASIGIATYPEDGNNAEELLSSADSGMYGVKHSKDIQS